MRLPPRLLYPCGDLDGARGPPPYTIKHQRAGGCVFRALVSVAAPTVYQPRAKTPVTSTVFDCSCAPSPNLLRGRHARTLHATQARGLLRSLPAFVDMLFTYGALAAGKERAVNLTHSSSEGLKYVSVVHVLVFDSRG
ncbi:hypothetical protein NDU88_005995 [Pleurodeles waltl]|uniref:Uncharacterized protein n=1 Tax=Pleurodeles waltl TaxID=8319 RepID=A0AAV7SN85_PLEWA|nr:hypothetical protein NDU88_005995 [Pleurodeles waltl]